MALLENALDYGLAACAGAIVLFLFWKAGNVFIDFLRKILSQRAGNGADVVGSSSGQHTSVFKRGSPAADSIRRIALTNHTLFSTIDGLIGLQLNRLRCGCEVRTKLLREMVRIYLEVWHERMMAFVQSQEQSPTFDSREREFIAELETQVNTLLVEIQEAIHTKWAQRGIPQQAVTAFDRWQSILIEMLVDHSKRMATSPFFPTNRERVVAIMAQQAFALSFFVVEAKITLKRMNGTLDGVEFDGQAIGPIENYASSGSVPSHQPVDPDADTDTLGPPPTPIPAKTRSSANIRPPR